MEKSIKDRLIEAFSPTECDVDTVNAENQSYHIRVVSEAFRDVPLKNRHQLINNLFEEELLSGKIHSLTISAKPPAAPAA
ncbi:BolA protein [Angomonas deanei]|uniref:BolA-like protein, putative n=1 Tax=Angomonas deanei TaxID=59799 RepID=A0A7G2CVW9_9TRYP|nr:BolA protein [Angomonas deanei]CAD2222573.1 BolA-like protein, putative [Angomonas deanei]|eukprot:EPY40212.1 BolA protein [Angomonas deanei]